MNFPLLLLLYLIILKYYELRKYNNYFIFLDLLNTINQVIEGLIQAKEQVLEENDLILEIVKDPNQEIIIDLVQEIERDLTQEIIRVHQEIEEDPYLEEKIDIEDQNLEILTNLEGLDPNLSFENILVNQRKDLHRVLQKVHQQLKDQ